MKSVRPAVGELAHKPGVGGGSDVLLDHRDDGWKIAVPKQLGIEAEARKHVRPEQSSGIRFNLAVSAVQQFAPDQLAPLGFHDEVCPDSAAFVKTELCASVAGGGGVALLRRPTPGRQRRRVLRFAIVRQAPDRFAMRHRAGEHPSGTSAMLRMREPGIRGWLQRSIPTI